MIKPLPAPAEPLRKSFNVSLPFFILERMYITISCCFSFNFCKFDESSSDETFGGRLYLFILGSLDVSHIYSKIST